LVSCARIEAGVHACLLAALACVRPGAVGAGVAGSLTMNCCYRLVWNDATHGFVPAPECARGRGKSGKSGKQGGRASAGPGPSGPQLLAGSALLAFSAMALAAGPAPNALPVGEQVVAGQAAVVRQGAQMTVNQGSDKAIINWQGFDIGAQAGVHFQQPAASSAALNRVVAGDASQIQGQLTANGQVYVVNPNGVVFGPGSQVNVGGLVASSLNITNQDFLDGKAVFSRGSATGAVENHGQITAADGGKVVLIGPTVKNEGLIQARLGTVALAAGDKVTLSAGADGLLQIAVDGATVDTLVENKQLIVADGGQVIMTSKAADALQASVVANSGTVRAQTIAQKNGRILLLADMDHGQTRHDGLLDASAPNGGDGGFIETSAAKVITGDDARVTTLAPSGETGTWLIDPKDYTIAASGGDITGAQVSANLVTNNIFLLSTGGSQNGDGSFHINDAISWTSANDLGFSAERNIFVNANITATNSAAKLTFNYGLDSVAAGNTANYYIADGIKINLPGGSAVFNTKQGSNGVAKAYFVINSLGVEGSSSPIDLQGLKNSASGNYALGADIDASATSGWNSGAGFTPYTNFSGQIAGLGHEISNLTINRAADNNIGLIGRTNSNTAVVRDLGIVGANITGKINTGILGGDFTGTISNVWTSGSVTGAQGSGGVLGTLNTGGTVSGSHSSASLSGAGLNRGGGLVGSNKGTISNSYATGDVNGGDYVGGLVGENVAGSTIKGSYATGAVSTSGQRAGGLVGQHAGTIQDSHATGNVTETGSSATMLGGLVGAQTGTGTSVLRSYATGDVTAAYSLYNGGLIGMSQDGTSVKESYATGQVSSSKSGSYNGGLIGYSSATTIQNTYASGAVSVSAGSTMNGGLVGRLVGGTITNSYSTGAVSGSGTKGGLLAQNVGGTVTNSFWDKDTSGQTTSAAGTGKTTAEMKTLSTFTGAGWDISTDGSKVWRYYTGYYPVLSNLQLGNGVIVTVASASKTYDKVAYSGGNGYTVSDPGAVSGTFSYGGDSQGAVNAGSYTISGSGLTLADSSQQGIQLWGGIEYVNGTLTINKKQLTVTGATAQNRTYDGTTAAAISGAALSGVIGGDTVTLQGGTVGSFASKNVGTGKVVTTSMSLGGAGAGNYSLAGQPAGLTANVTQATLKISTSDVVKTYDGGTSVAPIP